MVMVRGPGEAVVSPPTRLMAVSSWTSRRPVGEAFEPIGGDVRRECEGQKVGVAARSFGGEVGKIDRQGLVPNGGGRIVLQEVHTFNDGIAGDHELMALCDHEHGRVVLETERTCVGGKGREVARDDLELARPLLPTLDAVNHDLLRVRRILAAAPYGQAGRECRSPP